MEDPVRAPDPTASRPGLSGLRGRYAVAHVGRPHPNFEELSETLYKATRLAGGGVPGLVPDDVFSTTWPTGASPAGNFIRGAHELDYLEEPDVFHDVFGHVPMLMHPVMADFIQAYGQGGLRAQKLGKLTELARVCTGYTVEFGLVRELDGLRIYGAGIASSFSESRFSVQSESPNRIAF